MYFNYRAVGYPDNGHQEFAFHAEDHEQAKDIAKLYMEEAKLERIYVMTPDFKEVATIRQPQPVIPHRREFKIEVTYFKYVEYGGEMTQKDFDFRVGQLTDEYPLPECPKGWHQGRSSVTDMRAKCSDDDRYGKDAEKVRVE